MTEVVGGRFRIEELRGAGGMGEVFRAFDLEGERTVALKRLQRVDEDGVERFKREARALASVEHPHVVRHIAHGVDAQGRPWLSMEWLEGEDLAARLSRGRLAAAEAVELATRVAEALGAAHARGIVHRDVKPSNVFLVDGEATSPRLLDFGIAKLHDSTLRTMTGAMLGTIGYLSPEQARGAPLTPASDVFSLGCVLFEALTGRPLFEADHPVGVLGKVLMETPRAPSAIDPSLAPWDALLAYFLARDPAARPADGVEAARVLREGRVSLAPRGEVIGAQEREALVVVLVAPERPVDPQAETLAFAPTNERVAVAAIVEDAHARHEWYADGTLLVVAQLDPARDAALRAAHVAEELRKRLQRPTVLATGQGERASQRTFGQVVDRAAALLSSATRDRVLIDEVAASWLSRWFEIDESSAGALLGVERSNLQSLDRTPIIGRERELRLLADLQQDCVEGPAARGVLVVAPPGLGKSRLLREWLRTVSVPTWRAAGDPMRPAVPLGLVSQLVRHAAQIPAVATDDDARAKLAAHVRALMPHSEQTIDFLIEVAGLSPEQPSEAVRAARNERAIMSARVREAWEAFVSASLASPLVIAVEDMHWGDAPSMRLLESTLRRSSELPLFVVATARPELHATHPDLWRSEVVQEVRLAALPRRAAERLVRALWSDAVPADIERAIERAGGNPLWLEEIARERASSEGDSSDSLLATMQAHLAREPSEHRRLLRAASIFGERFWVDGVARLTHVERAGVERDLATLVEKDWLVPQSESRFPMHAELRFRHGLLRDSAYATLTAEDRSTGHRLAAEWLESAGEREAIALAEHLERSDQPSRAVTHYVRATSEALRLDDLAAAIAHAEKGLSLAPSTSERVQLQAMKGEALSWRGRVAEALGILRDAMSDMQPDDPGFVDMLGWVGLVATFQGETEPCIEAAGRMLALEVDRSTSPERARAVAYLVSGVCFCGRLDLATAILDKLEPTMSSDSERTPGWWMFAKLMRARFCDGDIWAEYRCGAAAHAAFERSSDTVGHVHALIQFALTELGIGAYESAERHVEMAAALDTRGQIGLHLGYTSGIRAVIAAVRGDVDRARAQIAETEVHAQGLGEVYGLFPVCIAAYACRLIGDHAAVFGLAERTLPRSKLPSIHSSLLLQRAGAKLATGDAAGALADAEAAAALTRASRMRGAFDLDFWATMVGALGQLGRVEQREVVRAKGRRLVDDRAGRFLDPELRRSFLSTPAVRSILG